MQRQQRVHRLLIRRGGERAGKQRHQLLGLGSLLLRQSKRVPPRHSVGRYGLEPDHGPLECLRPVGSLGGAGHLLEPFGGLLNSRRIFAGQVQVGVRRLAQIAAPQGGGADLGPDPRGSVAARERPVLPERLRVLPQAVGLVTPTLGVHPASARGAGQRGNQGPPGHAPVRPSIAR